jgi:hypothetical protein
VTQPHTHTDVARTNNAIRFEETRRLQGGGYCLAAHHPSFNQAIRFTITPADDHKGWKMTAWTTTQTCFENDTWSFPQLEATPLVGQGAMEDVLRRVAPQAEDPRQLSGWVFEISATLSRVLRYLTVYDAVGCSWRSAA